MKRALFTAVVLFLLASFFLGAAWAAVDGQKEEILITEHTLEGDPEKAAGLTVRMVSQWQDHLVWDTAYGWGSGKPESRFAFYSMEKSWPKQDTGSLELSCTTNWGTVRVESGEEPVYGEAFEEGKISLAAAVNGVAGRTKAGERRTETVALRDYYPYYPLELQLNKDGFDVYYDSEDEDWEVLTDYFRIPVDENHREEITVEKNEAGEVTQIQCSDQSETGIWGCSAFGQQGVYFAYYLEQAGKISKEPGENYGLYYLPYVEEEEKRGSGSFTVNPCEIRKACELEPGVVPIAMELDEREERLYLVSREEETVFLSIYRVEEGKAAILQKLPVRRVSGESGGEKNPYFRDLSVKASGALMVWADASFAFAVWNGEELELWRLEEEKVPDALFASERVWDFDGERLVLGNFADTMSVSVSLHVYERDGLAWRGLCEYNKELEIEQTDSALRISPPETVYYRSPLVDEDYYLSVRRSRIPVEEMLKVKWE